MDARIKNYRRGRKTQKPNEAILLFDGVDGRSKASKLIGRKVFWKSPAGKKLCGKITAVHGNSGALRAKFDSGLPGQAIGGKISLEQ